MAASKKEPVVNKERLLSRPDRALARAKKLTFNPDAMKRTPFIARPRTAFALSGGGAKGSFQLGVLRFLTEMRGIKPDLLAGTSVGAVNAAKLAEGDKAPADDPGYKPGLAGLLDIWHGLKKDEDMAIADVDLQKIMAIAKDEAVDAAIGLAGIGFSISVGLLPVAGCIAADIVSDLEKVKKMITEALYAGGIYSLAPVRKMVLDKSKFRSDLLEQSKIRTFLCWVGMLSGKTFYVDNRKRLFTSDDYRKPIGEVENHHDVIHASAAIPLIFKSPIVRGKINNRPFAELGYDGGVTEIAPVEVLAANGATTIYAIACAPAAPTSLISGEVGDAMEDMFETYQTVEIKAGKPVVTEKLLAESQAFRFLLTVGTRGLDLATSEVLRGDLRAKVEELHVIRPEVLVHETQQIDPALISVNEDHGWMCAHDAEIRQTIPVLKDNVEHQLPNPAAVKARGLNTAITLARRDLAIINKAVALFEKLRKAGVISNSAANKLKEAYSELRDPLRKTIRESVEERWKVFGLDSTPLVAGTWDD